MNLRSIALLVLPCMLLAAIVSGCAQERAPIDRVQPFALKKSFFVGEKLVDITDDPEFWARTTVTDVGYGAAQDGLFTSTYAQPLSRVKWQITEDLLIARLAYERIPGSDGKGVGKVTQDGVIVAAFAIKSHFDIKRAYNSATGEQMNVVEENGVDRPWYQRDYFRVDWSKNMNVDSYDFDTLSMMGLFGGIKYEALSYDVVDPSQEDAPYFADDGSYFDVTTKAFAKPGMIDLSALGWGIKEYPTCFLDADFAGGQAPAATCNPVELTLRHSFRKVVDQDYEPKEWDGYRFQSAGAFTTERNGYSRNYGMTDEQVHRFVERYNIWDRSHYYDNAAAMTGEVACYTSKTTPYGADPHRDEDGDGTEDECKSVKDKTGVGGSSCDTFKQRCTLPYQLRTARPVVWYYADGSNPEYFQPSEDATHEWDVALRAAAQEAKYAECKRVGTDPATCLTKFPVYFGQQDDNEDVIALAKEVDDCRHGIAYKDKGHVEAECIKIADDLGGATKRNLQPGVIAIAKLPEQVVLCHSPVEAGDPAVCAPADKRLPATLSAEACFNAKAAGDLDTLATCTAATHVRRGDLRYHQVNGIVEPATPSPWGIMVDGSDPTNGEKVAASINVWTYINELWSQGTVDMARYAAGELQASEITDGKYIKNWSAAAEAAASGGLIGGMTAEQASDRSRSSGKRVDPARAAQFAQQHPEAADLVAGVAQKLAGVTAQNDAPSMSAPIYQARRNAAANSAFEMALMTPMMQKMYGVQGMQLSASLMDMVSPMRGGNVNMQRGFKQMKENAMAARGACQMEMADAPLSIAGLGDVLQEKFGKFEPTKPEGDSDQAFTDRKQKRAEAMRRYLARRVHYAVVIHEMGHSVGLRHNFISSADAFNFRPQYWQLRTKDATVSKKCTTLVKATDAENCVGPRYFDPVTKTERDNLIWMWMQSSVMDYAGETTQDLLGLGAYDFHAPAMFYGDVSAVHSDDSFKIGQKRGVGVMGKMDNFGGILGLQPVIGGTKGATTNIHYSELQKNYALIGDCAPVSDPNNWKPGRWDDSRDGAFHPMLDGLIVKQGESYTRCRAPAVDYVQWQELVSPTKTQFTGFYRGGPAIDKDGRTRVPYGFATDTWADLGNASVYRHDNGADTYEIFNFMITQPEVNHIFDNYRRGRKSFAVRNAYNRSLTRYYEKMRDGAKGLGLYRNIYRDVALEQNLNPDDLWDYAAQNFFPDAVLAASMVFDHFTMITARPEAGDHYKDTAGILRATAGANSNTPPATKVTVPNGATGYLEGVSFGGKPVENALADDQGEYDSQFTMNAGSYYEKAAVAQLLTESVDNFISSTLGDFEDSRYRAVSIADLFPEGYRRFIGNALTGDDFIKGARIALKAPNGDPEVDADKFPVKGLGFTSWYGTTPVSCFPGSGSTICRAYGQDSTPFAALQPKDVAPIDAQIGYEQQKFFIAWTMLYLFENEQQSWLDQLRLWELGVDADPNLGAARMELHYPDGKTYVARYFGKEPIFGKTVQQGIGARVLEYANSLMKDAYVTDPGTDLDNDGTPDWYLPKSNPATGAVLVQYDPAMQPLTAGGGTVGCSATDNSGCTCADNQACMKLKQYMSVPFFLRQAVDAYGLDLTPHSKALYP
jgi:hypothetical protein